MLLFQVACWGWLWVCLAVAYTYGRVPRLDSFAPVAAVWPRVSIIVPARNEAETVVSAMATLLRLDYPELEVVLVNDRSEDGTGDLAESLARTDPRLKVVHIQELPDGWLGKNHALHQGAAGANGELLLFTDADIHFAPSSLKRAVVALTTLNVQHLSCAPRIVCLSFWEKIFVPFFALAFGMRYRPHRASSSDPNYYVGVGAFNLIRREVYQALGGHSLLRLQVLDDMELAHLVKLRGYRQTGLRAVDLLEVRWTVGLEGVVKGLEKNAYAGFDYVFPQALIGAAAATVASVAPLVLLLLGPWWLGLAAWAAVAALSVTLAREAGGSDWAGLCLPLSGTLLAGVTMRSAVLAEVRRGIRWRGCFYPLSELRRQHLA